MDASKQPALSDLADLTTQAIYPFMQIYRATPLPFAAGRYENDAEHSWSVAFMACALAPHIDTSLDVGLVAQFALVHDLVELYAGDTSNFAPESEKTTKKAREIIALKKIGKEFAMFPWIGQTTEAYERQESNEAKFVKSVDKVLLLLFDVVSEGKFYQESRITMEHWRTTMRQHREKARIHTGAFYYYDLLWDFLLIHPEFFYRSEK